MDKTKIAVEVFDKFATLYQEKFMDVNLYGDTFDFFCNTIKKQDADLFEIACGPGNITKYLLNKRPDLKIVGIDLASAMIELAKINNPAAEFHLMDCRQIATINKKFDAIMCGFCLPYLTKDETIKLFSDASKLLNPKGVFYISTMEDDYNKSGFKKGSTGDEIFMHFYQADFLTAILKENNFNILKLDRKEYDIADGAKTKDLIIIAEKL